MPITRSAKMDYRHRVKYSKCRGLRGRTCNTKPGCKFAAKGKKRTFCRKSKNTKRAIRTLRIRKSLRE